MARAGIFDGPMLMIRGERDRAVNSAPGPTVDAMTGRENFRLVELADAGHCANLDQPDEVRKLIEEIVASSLPSPSMGEGGA